MKKTLKILSLLPMLAIVGCVSGEGNSSNISLDSTMNSENSSNTSLGSLVNSENSSNTNSNVEDSSMDLSSNPVSDPNFSMILPSGTPLLGMTNYLHENKNHIDHHVSDGSDPLIAAFTSKTYDVIVAPVNLGAKMYSTSQEYKLFETFVWGNLYIVSNEPVNSFTDLNGKDITLFGTNSTPDIIMKTLAREYNISYNATNVESVAVANAAFMQNKASIIVSAEPSLSKLKEKKPNAYVLDLQEEWKKITKSSSYPQAGIFVKSSKVDELKDELLEMRTSVNNILNDKEYTVSCALEEPTLEVLGHDTIYSAIDKCHFGIDENQEQAIEFYFNKLIDLELGKTMGGTLPNDDFYLQI